MQTTKRLSITIENQDTTHTITTEITHDDTAPDLVIVTNFDYSHIAKFYILTEGTSLTLDQATITIPQNAATGETVYNIDLAQITMTIH